MAIPPINVPTLNENPVHRRILIVEDSIVAGMMMTARIEREQPWFDVRVRKSIKGGKEEFSAFKPHVVILDAELPDSSWCETLREIPFFHQDGCRVIVVTSHAIERESMDAGADDFMEKTIGEDATTLMSRINALTIKEPETAAP